MIELTAERAFILDMDGVLYRGDQPADGLRDLFKLLPTDRVVCVTNNSLFGAEELTAKLGRMGVELPPDRFIPVCDAVRSHLARTARPGTRTFVLGAPPLHRAVRASGMRPVDGAAVDERPEIIVLGLDLEQRFEHLATATLALRAGARLVATSDDRILLTEHGAVPGTGAFVALLLACADVAVELVGKPHRPMFERALEVLDAPAEDVIVVGDSLDADIAGGRAIGATTVLLTSGVSGAAAGQGPAADHVVPSLRHLVDRLQR